MNAEGFEAPGNLVAPAELPLALQVVPGTTTVYLSSHGYTSQHGDTPADTHFEGRMTSPFSFGRSIIDAQGFTGSAEISLGDVVLANGDGYLDPLINGYTIDGRQALFKVGSSRSASYSTFTQIFKGMGGGWYNRKRESVNLRLADMMYRLNVPLQTTLYAGTGGLAGPSSLQNLPLPVCLGQVQNITPVLVDPLNMIYQVNWRTVQSIDVVREAGEPITQTAGTPGIGQWQANNAAGTFKLGYTPAGQITCDVHGDNGGVGYDPSCPGLIKKVTKDLGAGLQDSDLDLVALAQLAFDVPGVCGWYQDATVTTVSAALAAVVAGFVGYVGTNRLNQISAGIIKAPTTTPAFILNLEDIDDLQPIDPPADFFPPPERVRVGYGKNWSPTNLLAGAISDATRALLQAPFYGIASAFSNSVASAFLAAQDAPIFQSILLNQGDATARATQILNLYSPSATSTRQFYTVTTGRYLGQMELGYTGQLFHPDFGMSLGWYGTVVAWAEDLSTGTLTLKMVG